MAWMMGLGALVRVIYLILPVILAGMGHVAVLKLDLWSRLAVPIDGRLRWRGRRVLGENKTWRGLLLMSGLSAVLTQVLDICLYGGRRPAVLSRADDLRPVPWVAGAIMGLSYALA